MQVYEAPAGPVVHADFYRLRGPRELDNLGWDEAVADAIAIVEWPERIAEALPADRLEVEIRFDPSRGPDFRLLTLRGKGAVSRRLALALGVARLLKRAGWSGARREFLQGDASIRAYERLTRFSGATAILMISPPRRDGPILRYGKPYVAIAKLSPDIRAFVAMADGLRGLGYSAPALIAFSVDEGLALIEDFGSATIAGGGVPDGARYAEAVVLLVDLHGRELPVSLPVGDESYALPVYDIEAMLVEVELVLDWYAPAVARVTPPTGARMQFLAIWRELLGPILAQPTTWTLRDFHSPNLHWLAERQGLKRIGLIDFQDAVLGPPAYDVASLLQDARVDVPEDLEMRLAALYMRRRTAADPAFDVKGFAAAYAAMGAQRATKILGIFARLDKRDGKPEYLGHLPRIERYLDRNLAHPLLRPLALWYQNHLPRALGAPPQVRFVERCPTSRRRHCEEPRRRKTPVCRRAMATKQCQSPRGALRPLDCFAPLAMTGSSPMSPPVPKTAMVFAAGLGLRMRPITDTLPKPLVKVGGRALIDHCLDRLAENGVERAVVNLHWLADQIEAHLAGRRSPKILISDERATLLDQGGGIKRALPMIGDDPFLICNTDAFWIEGPRSNIARLASAFDPEAMDILLLVATGAGAVGVDWPGDFAMSHDGRLECASRAGRRPSSTRGRHRQARVVRERARGSLSPRAVLSCGGGQGPALRRPPRWHLGACRAAREHRSGGAGDHVVAGEALLSRAAGVRLYATDAGLSV